MQTQFDFTAYVADLDDERRERWQHGAAAAVVAVRDITAGTWELAAALHEMLMAGGESRLKRFWQTHLQAILSLKVARRLVRLWRAFQNHPERDMMGPNIWAFVHHDLTEDELNEVEQMAKAGASADDLRDKLEQLGRAADERRAARPHNEAAVQATVQQWLEKQGTRVEPQYVLKNGRVCDLVTDEHVIEVKADLSLKNWDKAVGQVDSYHWCMKPRRRVLAFESHTPDLQLLMRQALDNDYALLRVDCQRGVCEWIS